MIFVLETTFTSACLSVWSPTHTSGHSSMFPTLSVRLNTGSCLLPLFTNEEVTFQYICGLFQIPFIWLINLRFITFPKGRILTKSFSSLTYFWCYLSIINLRTTINLTDSNAEFYLCDLWLLDIRNVSFWASKTQNQISPSMGFSKGFLSARHKS